MSAVPGQVLLEHDEVIAAVGVPVQPDDVVAELDRQMQHRAVAVVTLQSDRFVVVLGGPALGRFHEL